VEKLPFEPATFSNVLTVNTVYFWTSLEAGFDEIRRVLTPGGRAVIGFMPKEHMIRKNMPTDIFTLRTENDITSAIKKSQFSEVRVERPDAASPWAVVVAIR
jgi:arsenite methyltransferase